MTQDIRHLIEAATKREQERVASELADAQIRVVTATFSQAAAYTNLITLGAYAGFFGLWQLTEKYISKQQALWAALLMLVSLSVFILFEVYKMSFVSRQSYAKAQLLSSPEARVSPHILLQKLNELELLQQGQAAFSMRVWMVALSATVGSGLFAAGILVYAFIVGLL